MKDASNSESRITAFICEIKFIVFYVKFLIKISCIENSKKFYIIFIIG